MSTRANSPGLHWLVLRWCWQAALRQQPSALAAAVLAIALGVALALGINLVNQSALTQFSQAINTINGSADAQLTTADGRLPDAALEAIAQHPVVERVSPIIDTRVVIANATPQTGTASGLPKQLRIIGLDVFAATAMTPALIPKPGSDSSAGTNSDLFADDVVFLSPAALTQLKTQVGQPLTILVNGRRQQLRIAGSVPGTSPNQVLGVMDIGTAQWRLDWKQSISRIDLRLRAGANIDSLSPWLKQNPGWLVAHPAQEQQQTSNLSRAYRVNLNVLALVALFTGGFIVYASMSLVTMRLSSMLALLNVLGSTYRLALAVVVGLGLVMGIVGAVLGIVLGIMLAHTLLNLIGADLGGGYFGGGNSGLVLTPRPVFLFGLLGVIAATAGALLPALQLRQMAPATTLKSGQAVHARASRRNYRIPFILTAIGLILLAIPPIDGLPIAAYLSIACLLFAGIALTGPICAGIIKGLTRHGKTLWPQPTVWLASQRLSNDHGSTVSALAGVVASFALVCSMAVMVHSFRVSVDDWLEQVLPADLYVQVPVSGAQAGFNDADIAALSRTETVADVKGMRVVNTRLSAAGTSISLIAREVTNEQSEVALPVIGRSLANSERQANCVPVFPSEPAARRFNLSVGDSIKPSIAYAPDVAPHCFQVVAVWRDYARQQGALVIDIDDYRMLTGDQSIDNLAISMTPGTRPDAVMQTVRSEFSDLPGVMLRSAADIRQLSLEIFDRSFAVTYALEAVALLVGLFGVVTTYAGEALSRAREFGMLRHLGVTQAQIARMFAAEAGASITIGVIWGALLGAVIAKILIDWVNPQSFHWTMQTHWSMGLLLLSAAAILTLGVLAAVVAARRAGGLQPIAAVREDW